MPGRGSIVDVLEGRAEWAMVLGDCGPVLAGMGAASVDVVITDAGYDIKTHAGYRNTPDIAKGNNINFAPSVPGDVGPPLVWVAKRWAITFCALEQLGGYQAGVDCWCTPCGRPCPALVCPLCGAEAAEASSWVRAGVWMRNTGPQRTGDRPAQGAEGVAIMHRPGRKRWNGGGMPAVWRGDTQRGDDRPDVATPKPPALMADLVRKFTEPGEVVLDAYAGGGTTGAACLLLGRRFIGVEIDQHSYEVACGELERAEVDVRGGALFKQVTLF